MLWIVEHFSALALFWEEPWPETLYGAARLKPRSAAPKEPSTEKQEKTSSPSGTANEESWYGTEPETPDVSETLDVDVLVCGAGHSGGGMRRRPRS